MRRFADLFATLDGTRSTDRKVEAIEAYLREAPPLDAAWALFLLTGRRLQRLVTARALGDWALHATGLPAWQLEAAVAATGDVAEAIALLVDATRGAEEGGAGGAPEQARAGGAGQMPSTPPDDPSSSEVGERPRRPHHPDETEPVSLSTWIARLQEVATLAPEAQREAVAGWWRGLREDELFLLVKLLTGELRVGVSRGLVERALARVTGLERTAVALRLTGPWVPSAELMARLRSPLDEGEPSRPLPFMLASPLEVAPASLGPVSDWLLEWKWDGIRAQLVRRAGDVWLWSRGEELITERFPEVRAAAAALPDGTVIDGELLAVRGDAPLPFALLQRRIGRTRLTTKVRAEAPVALLAFDLLEDAGEDLRAAPLEARRARLLARLAALPADERTWLRPSAEVEVATWDEALRARDGARERGVEGLMLKRRESPWRPGRRRGDWWKWKVDPYTFDAVLVAAEPGMGRRASLYTALTFAVWDDRDGLDGGAPERARAGLADQAESRPQDDTSSREAGERSRRTRHTDDAAELVTVARAYSGLDDEELRRLDRWIRRHTVEQFGPVRTVEPAHVFELRCEGVARSPRHRSGLAVRFPRIARWRTDRAPPEADTLTRLAALVPPEPPPPRPGDVPGGQLTLFE